MKKTVLTYHEALIMVQENLENFLKDKTTQEAREALLHVSDEVNINVQDIRRIANKKLMYKAPIHVKKLLQFFLNATVECEKVHIYNLNYN